MTSFPPAITLLCVVGARPNFVKMAPILKAFSEPCHGIHAVLVHTGQHYDQAMSGDLFGQLELPLPEVNLGVGSGTHAVQIAEVMLRLEPVMDAHRPDAVLVVGDVNSTLAAALVAAKKGIKVIHVEAGLRSGDRHMPEEQNRILTDQLADMLLTTESSARDNLLREGIAPERIHFVGNVMIDTLLAHRSRAPALETILAKRDEASPLPPMDAGFGLVTLHRPANVDDPDMLAQLLDCLCDISLELPLVWPLHPRTRSRLCQQGLDQRLGRARIVTLPPVGYHDMLGLMSVATLVLTDSGGVQEETTVLGVPCLTLREETERPITVTEGSNQLVGRHPASIRAAVTEVLSGRSKPGRVPMYWDGKTATRIAGRIRQWANDDWCWRDSQDNRTER